MIRPAITVCAAVLLAGAAPAWCGGVKFDGSFGRSDALAGPGFLIPADAGKQADGNLFHSFSQFDLSNGDTATFQAPISGPNVGNIFARVTAGPASNIDGTIRSGIAGANLFLINPRGVILGTHVVLDITGSFTATTASSVKLSDGERFKAIPGARDLTLSAAPVSAFGFLPASGPVSLKGSIAVPAGKDISFLGGGVSILPGSTIQFIDSPAPVAPGRVTLLATQSGGNIPADFGRATADGFVFLLQSTLDASAQAGGRVVIRSGDLTVDRSSIKSDTRGAATGGTMDIRVAGTAELKLNSSVLTSTSGGGKAGTVVIRAGKLSVENPTVVGSQSLGTTTATARAGRVNVRADKIHISGGGIISVSNFGLGRGGSVDVTANTMSLFGDGAASNANNTTGIFSSAGARGTARGGTVRVSISGQLSIENGAAISADTGGLADGGDVHVTAGSLLIDAVDARSSGNKTGVFADTNSQGAGGHGGNVQVTSDTLRIIDGGLISTKTLGLGASGDAVIDTRLLKISRGNAGLFTGIAADSPLPQSGPGGSVRVTADTIKVTDGGQISSNAFGVSDGGSVTVSAREIFLNGGRPDILTGITADSISSGAGGRSGDIRVSAENLTILDGARISATTFGQGDSGSLSVGASHLLIRGGTSGLITGIAALTTSKAPGGGAGGDVNVTADRLSISAAGRIGADTLGTGSGGRVNVTSNTVRLTDSGAIGVTAEGTGNGGTLSVAADSLSVDDFGSIEAKTTKRNGGGEGGGIAITARILTLVKGGQISAATTGSGAGGDITITAPGALSIFKDGLISGSTSGSGRGGSISVTTPTLALTGGLIRADTSSTGVGGDVTLRANRIDASAAAQITAQTNGPAVGGKVSIMADAISLTEGAAVSGETRGAGAGGSVAIGARTLHLAGANSGIKANSFGPGASGDLIVSAGEISMESGSQIGASTSGTGAGGSIAVDATTLRIDGGGTRTGIFADTKGRGQNAGDGGTVRIATGDLTLAGTGQISATTGGGGKAGDVMLRAGVVNIRSLTLDEPTGVFAAASAAANGPGGSIGIVADTLTLDGPGATVAASSAGGGTAGSIDMRAGSVLLQNFASVAVTSTRTDAGSVSITSDSFIDLFSGSSVTASAGANGGSVTLNAVDRFYLRDSSVTSVAGTATAGIPGAVGGAGGNIFIDPTYVILDNGLISANAAIGAGGNILIVADNFLASETLITATGTTAGTIVISAPQVDLTSGLVTLPASLVDASTRLQERCTMRLGMQTSSFLVIGRGGVEISPRDPLPAAVPRR